MTRKKISYAEKKVFIGIDVHRKFNVVTAICEGVVVKRCRVDNSFESLMNLISKYFDKAEVKTCYEAGFSGFWLHRKLTRAGVSNFVVNPASIAVEANNRVKTDKRDSLKLAEQLSTGYLKSIYIPSEERERSRLVPRTREQLKKARHRLRVQIRMRLHHFGLFPKNHIGVLSNLQAKAIINDIEIVEIKSALKMLLLQWINLNTEISKLDKQIKAEGKDNKLESIYRTVPGIGWLSARILASELGDMKQFSNERSLSSYTGLTPSEYSSGEHTRRGHISKQGSRRLRAILIECAWVAIRKDPALKKHYLQLSKRRGGKIAIVAIARKLICKVRAVIKNQERYEINHIKKVA